MLCVAAATQEEEEEEEEDEGRRKCSVLYIDTEAAFSAERCLDAVTDDYLLCSGAPPLV